MVDLAHRIVNILLELNVLNVEAIERQLKNLAARSLHPAVKTWLMTVARNYIINLEGEAAEKEYQPYSTRPTIRGRHRETPTPEQLPDWAKGALTAKKPVHHFDYIQPRRRELWQTMETIVDWFNTWPKDKPELKEASRLSHISFEEAAKQAQAWKAQIDKSPWMHIREQAPVVKAYENGYKWVRLLSDMHLKREDTLMNHCFQHDTKIITDCGLVPIGKQAGKTVNLLTQTTGGFGQWMPAAIQSYGLQKLYKVTLKRGQGRKTIFSTELHRWFVVDKIGAHRSERHTTDLKPGDKLPFVHAKPVQFRSQSEKGIALSPVGIMHGITFGDGHACVDNLGAIRSGRLPLYGKKNLELLKWFPIASRTSKITRSIGGICVEDLPRFFKRLPDINESAAYLLGWLAGYFAADGCVDKSGNASISSANSTNLKFVELLAQRFGLKNTGISTTSRLGLGNELSDLHKFTFEVGSLPNDFFLISNHRKRNKKRTLSALKWTVASVQPTDRLEEVFCAIVPETHSFAIEGNILTGNCVGNRNYVQAAKTGTEIFFSLRDPRNKPHITIAASKGATGGLQTNQVKGNSNQKPNAVYQPYLADFLKSQKITVHGDSHNVDPNPGPIPTQAVMLPDEAEPAKTGRDY